MKLYGSVILLSIPVEKAHRNYIVFIIAPRNQIHIFTTGFI